MARVPKDLRDEVQDFVLGGFELGFSGERLRGLVNYGFDIDVCKTTIYNQKPQLRERGNRYQRQYEMKYRQTPEMKECKRKYDKEYRKRPEVKERRRECQRESYKRLEPEAKERILEYQREYGKEYRKIPEVKEKKRLYDQRRRAKMKRDHAKQISEVYRLKLKIFKSLEHDWIPYTDLPALTGIDRPAKELSDIAYKLVEEDIVETKFHVEKEGKSPEPGSTERHIRMYRIK